MTVIAVSMITGATVNDRVVHVLMSLLDRRLRLWSP